MNETIERIFQRSLFELGGQSISLLWIFQLLVALSAVGVATHFIKKFLKNRLLSRLGMDGGNREAIATLVSFGVGSFGYLIVLQATGIDLSSLAVIIGGLGVGIGFGLQDIAKNLLSGLTVLLERKLRVGDFIEFDNIAGYIEEISIRSTVIRTLEGGEVMIPNSQLAEERITNWSYRNFRGRLEIEVGVAYGSDPVLVTETLLEAAYSMSDVLRDPSPRVIFVGFGDSSLDFKLWFWVERVDLRAYIQSDLTFTIEYYLRQRDIEIPFPQLDLWARSPHHFSELSGFAGRPPSAQIALEIDREKSFDTKHDRTDTLRAWLSQVSYFQSFNELQMRSLIEMGFRHRLETSEVFRHQGETAREFCIILSGAIGVFHKIGELEQHLITFEAGQYFGELPLMLGVPYPATVKATAHTTLFVINETSFEKLLRNYPALAEDISQELSRRKAELDAYQEELRAMGVNTETEHPVVWIRQRLKELFKITFA